MCLAQNIRYLRKKKGLSQDSLAEMLGYKSYTTIQKWESGVSEPPIKALRKMADMFGVDMNDMATIPLESESGAVKQGYYMDNETVEMAQSLLQNKEMRVLFDAARDAKPEDLKTAADVLLALKRKEGYSGDDPA